MEGENANVPRHPNRLSEMPCGEWDRSELFGVIGDTARGWDGRTDGAGVNYWGLNFRTNRIWLNSPLTSPPTDG